MANINMYKAIQLYLYEQEDDDNDDEKQDDTPNEKEQEVQSKDLSDVDKDDLEDDDIEEGDVAVSITLNDNLQGGGKIKLVSFRRLPAISSIESILKLFDFDANNMPDTFKDMVQITIRSPLADFVNESYEIRLMDGTGEIEIERPDLSKTISKTSPGGMNMQQAVQDQVDGEEPAQQINLGYLPELNYEFRQAVKNEFFNRILAKR